LVREALLRARARFPDSLVVFRNRGGNLLVLDSVTGAFNRAFGKVGLPEWATHILRHTAGTLPMAVPGVRLEDVQVNHGQSSREQAEEYAKVRAVITNTLPHTLAGLVSQSLAEASRPLSRPEGRQGRKA
jgi:hypothetical protein